MCQKKNAFILHNTIENNLVSKAANFREANQNNKFVMCIDKKKFADV